MRVPGTGVVSRFGLLLVALVMAALAAGCSEEMPVEDSIDGGGSSDVVVAAAADLSGVEVEMRHEPG